MTSAIARRAFVGTLAAGLPMAAGIGAFTQSPRGRGAGAQTHDHHNPQGEIDPMLDHLAREIVGVHNRAQTRGHLTGEDARALAAQFRTLGVYARRIDLDGLFRQHLRDLVREKGRDAIIFAVPDERSVRDEHRRYGLNVDRRFFDAFQVGDYAARSRAVDELLREGVSPTFLEVAALFQHAAPRFDQTPVHVARVVARQDAAYWSGYCASLAEDIQKISAMAAATCAPILFPYWWGMMWGPACAAVSGGLAILSADYFFYC